jgi:hypothetical protein
MNKKIQRNTLEHGLGQEIWKMLKMIIWERFCSYKNFNEDSSNLIA